MTQAQQNQLIKQLKQLNYRSHIEKRGHSWRLRVSVSNAKLAYVREEYERDSTGLLIRAETGGFKTKQVIEFRQHRLNEQGLLIWLQNNGWPHARLIRCDTNSAVFEIDHRNNFWKILAEI